jgi:hypothetical protein
MMRYGTWVWEKDEMPTYESMKAEKQVKLDYLYNPGYGMSSSVVETHVKRSFMEPYLGRVYTQVIPVSTQDNAYAMMEKAHSSQKLFIEEYEPADDDVQLSQEFKDGESMVELVYSSFNRLQFRALSPAPAFFGLSYPYTGHWRARVNDRNVPVYRANGAAHAVQIPKGESFIEFRYVSSAAFWGMLISCATFTLIGLVTGFRTLKGPELFLVLAVVLAAGSGLFILWQSSLYTGDNLGTEYTWYYESPPSTPNLAYGKKTFVENPHWRPNLQSSRAVDGDVRPESGFLTSYSDNPFLILDLHKVEKVKRILLYESRGSPLIDQWWTGKRASWQRINTRPLSLAVSRDGEQWLSVSSITSEINRHSPIRIVFEQPHDARFLKLEASGNCVLSFDEVEIYGPENVRKKSK